MKIDCFFTHAAFALPPSEQKTVVVIDILRATSTMVTALTNGALEIIPINDVARALRQKECMPQAVLSGERDGSILPGFDLGNSPFEFSAQAVAGKTLIACTTNGTGAIEAAKNAGLLLIGALVNAQAAARAALVAREDVCLLCSGTAGRLSYDDVLGAGAVISRMLREEPAAFLSDAAKIALQTYDLNRRDLLGGLLRSQHGEKLARLGRGDDVVYCAREDILPIAPVYSKGRIRA